MQSRQSPFECETTDNHSEVNHGVDVVACCKHKALQISSQHQTSKGLLKRLTSQTQTFVSLHSSFSSSSFQVQPMLKVRSPAERLNRQKGATEPRRTQASSRSSHDAQASMYCFRLFKLANTKRLAVRTSPFSFSIPVSKNQKGRVGLPDPKCKALFSRHKNSLSVRFLRTTNSVFATTVTGQHKAK